jgi:hypothetical protein
MLIWESLYTASLPSIKMYRASDEYAGDKLTAMLQMRIQRSPVSTKLQGCARLTRQSEQYCSF